LYKMSRLFFQEYLVVRWSMDCLYGKIRFVLRNGEKNRLRISFPGKKTSIL
jgi:hypothetical protein